MEVTTYLKDKGVRFEHMRHAVAFTAQQVAAEQHVPGRMMVKTVVVKADGKYVMAVLPAIYNVDFAKLRKVLAAKSVTLATEAEMAKLFPDCDVGAEPPLGEVYGLPVLVEEHLATSEEVVFQSGTHTETIRMGYADFMSLTEARTASFGQHI